MNIKNIKNKIASTQSLLKIISSNKNITLINILKLTKEISFYYQRAKESKYLIESLDKQYDIYHPLITGKQNLLNVFKLSKNKHKILWIYITETEQYETNSYSKHEKILTEKFRKNSDFIIAIGKRAIDFTTKNEYEIVYKALENNVEELTRYLPSFIEHFATSQKINGINFLINSSKIKQHYLSVLPLEDFSFDFKHYKSTPVEEINVNKLNILPNLNSFVDAEMHSYLTYITLTLLSESALINEKYKLVEQNKKINQLEDREAHLKLSLLRAKRELEVEQISLLTKKKDILHTKENE
ncbi:Uncharacterised protein [Metamycoplasma cloacale]|uniref:Uncharacterized protein n=1 Tax=Metamycoplasma cloacale TaxID=92401 RepID=A0A2Z4LLJ5_9BACT|nr:F0F1 ATP synthase subunit gamma [Metamycoplasma cloacale]AWX42576.1 hypothetical protein DK849_00550 [Metamycoplasma cloacale]VEU79714.1 Uncharacterised protein [Metamycoplasma cloacale]